MRYDRLEALVRMLSPKLEHFGFFRSAVPDAIASAQVRSLARGKWTYGLTDIGRSELKPPWLSSQPYFILGCYDQCVWVPQGRSLATLGLSVLSEQRGALRVNCVDCLDRTNVGQSLMAHEVFFRQLQALHCTIPGGARPPARTREGGNQGGKEGEGLHAVACTLRHSVRRKGVRAKPTECQRGIGALDEHTLYFVCIASVATECRHWRIRRENVAVVCRRRPAVRASATLRYILHCILDVEW
jgi:hypothetical protein